MDPAVPTTEVETGAATSALVPTLVALAAPSSVVASLATTGNALVAFAVYHVVLCSLVPVAALRLSAHEWSEITAHLGLRSPSREGWLVGALAGGFAGGGILLAALVLAEGHLAELALADRLSAWGIAGSPALLFGYMLAFNSGAEELLWRGYLHTEAVGRLGPAVGIGALSLLFASYHLYTLWMLLPAATLAVLGALGVLSGGLLWALLRQRYASLVPAVLAHVGATAGYMTVYVVLV